MSCFESTVLKQFELTKINTVTRDTEAADFCGSATLKKVQLPLPSFLKN